MRRPASVSEERAQDPEAAREAALGLLERTRRTRSDLARRLRDRGYAAPAIEEALGRLTRVGLVDDAEYARAYLAGRWGRRMAGWRRLEADLRRRGVGAGDITAARQAFETLQGPADEAAAARRVIDQARRRYAKLDPRVRQQRLYALLARRGFGSDVIIDVLRSGGADETIEGGAS